MTRKEVTLTSGEDPGAVPEWVEVISGVVEEPQGVIEEIAEGEAIPGATGGTPGGGGPMVDIGATITEKLVMNVAEQII